MFNAKTKIAPCGCSLRAAHIERSSNFLFPTAFVTCNCKNCKKTWTERYEFDFAVPLNGLPWEHESNKKVKADA